MSKNMNIPLMENTIGDEEIKAIHHCLSTGKYTQGKIVKDFEEKFSEWNGSRYSIMVNSGSSANLLMVFALKERYGLKDDDEVLVPAVTWPTTVYPLIQNNLIPVFCDVDETFNISIRSMEKMISKKTKALFLVHILGQSADMDKINEFCKKNDLLLIEDCCESMGAEYKEKKTGTNGLMGGFSLYFGHHITTIEGGIITTDDPKTADILRSARSHGWVRGSLREEKYKKNFKNTSFVFDMLGYNLRSTDVNASIGLVQLKKLDSIIAKRKENMRLFIQLLSNKESVILQKISIDENSSFSLPIILESKDKRDLLLDMLPQEGIECRPIIAGNLLRQPIFKERYTDYRSDKCNMSDIIHEKGLYLPNNQFIDEEKIRYMVQKIISLL